MNANITPFALLRANIAAEMTANGTTHADAAAFNAWLYSAWIDAGFTADFACLYQSGASATFSVGIRVANVGHKVNFWWGDGSSSSYTPGPDSDTTVSKTYGSLAKRPIIILGRITHWTGTSGSYGGRLWRNLRSLTYLDCGGCPLVAGSISEAPDGLTLLDCAGCQTTYENGGRVWSSGVSGVYVSAPTPEVFTSAMTDALLIDLAASNIAVGATFSITGYCGVPTSASDAAIDSLLSRGATINTN